MREGSNGFSLLLKERRPLTLGRLWRKRDSKAAVTPAALKKSLTLPFCLSEAVPCPGSRSTLSPFLPSGCSSFSMMTIFKSFQARTAAIETLERASRSHGCRERIRYRLKQRECRRPCAGWLPTGADRSGERVEAGGSALAVSAEPSRRRSLQLRFPII